MGLNKEIELGSKAEKEAEALSSTGAKNDVPKKKDKERNRYQ